MGNFLSFKPSVSPYYLSYDGLTLTSIHRKYIRQFLQLQFAGKMAGPNADLGKKKKSSIESPSSPSSSSSSSSKPPPATVGNYGYEVDFPAFHLLFPQFSAEEAARHFRLWDSNEDGLIDLLEVFTTLILFAKGGFEAKIGALFRLFDFDDSGGLSFVEFQLLVTRVIASWSRVLGVERNMQLEEEEIDEISHRGMMLLQSVAPTPPGKLRPPSEVSERALQMWCGTVNVISTTLSRHHTTDGDKMREFWSAVLAKKLVDLTGRLQSTAENRETFRADALRIYTHFKSWIPIHRQMIDWQQQHEQKVRAEQAASSITAAIAANAANPLSPSNQIMRGLKPRPKQESSSSPAPSGDTSSPNLLTGAKSGGAPNSGRNSSHQHAGKNNNKDNNNDDDGPRSKRDMPILPPSLEDAPSKLQSHTVSSYAKDKRLQEGLLFLPKSTLEVMGDKSDAVMHETLKMIELRESGLSGAEFVSNPSSPASAAAKRAAVEHAQQIRTNSGIKHQVVDEEARHRPAYLAIKRIKAKVQSHRTKDDPHYQHFVYDHTTLKQAKNLFDSLDLDGSGEIEIAELTGSLEGNPHLGAAISAFKSLDVDQTGTIDFQELLRAIFPLASGHHVRMMVTEVKAIEITKKDIEFLQKAFEWCDEDFDGKVLFKEFLSYLRDKKTDPSGKRKDFTRDYVPTRSIYELEDERLMQFHEAMIELFSKSHMHMIQDIKRWSSHLPVFALTDKQHVELEQLFELYDADGSGTIDMDELVAHFTNLGFTEEDNERMFRLFDRDGGGSVDMVEFKRFYRSVYDSTRTEDYGRGVTTHSGGILEDSR